ncbi:hypothetical protein [Tropicimonas sp. IMCC6043]|nr:hypothetical protein [Tropicimonas sp. IMCC6043]
MTDPVLQIDTREGLPAGPDIRTVHRHVPGEDTDGLRDSEGDET